MTTKVISVEKAARYIRAADIGDATPMDFFHWGRKGLIDIEKRGNNSYVNFHDMIVVRTIVSFRIFGAYKKDSEIIALHETWKKILSVKYKFDTDYPLANKISMSSGADLDLTFDESGMAVSWIPSRGVEIHPGYLCGAPRIMGRRIHTEQVAGMLKNGVTYKDVMWWLRINQREIKNAVRWEEMLDNARI